jgi:hypothetical protein
VRDKTRSWLIGIITAAVGLVLAITGYLLMFGPGRTRKWQLALFSLGVCLLGWGAVLLLPGRWLRVGVLLMLVGTPILVVTALLLSQGLPS